jgi:hypothetical protein
MEFGSEYPYKIKYNNVEIKCKEVEFPGKNYSKLITSDHHVVVLYSPGKSNGQGNRWSNFTINNEYKHQLVFDSRIVMYVLSSDFNSTFSGKKMTSETEAYYRRFMKYVFPSNLIPSNDSFTHLQVQFIPENTSFGIKGHVDGDEEIVII